MSVLIQMCFIHVVGGYLNVAQIQGVGLNPDDNIVYVSMTNPKLASFRTGDKTPEDFLKRVQDTCGGKRG